MAILIMAPGRETATWERQFSQIDPALDLRIWPKCGNHEDIELIVSWNHPPGELLKFPNLKCVASLGAGVDHILRDPGLPKNIHITRVVDKQLTRMMVEYVCMATLYHYRQFDRYEQQKRDKQWIREPFPSKEVKIGIMGLGELGRSAAMALKALQFNVLGWARTPKNIPGITAYAGEQQFADFLSQSNILICLLPLTPQTQNILNRHNLSKLPKNAYVINVARGEHLVEEELLELINSGHLAGACLDVFRQEPLPPDHPFWHHPKIMITPHIASITSAESVAAQIVENYRRLKQNKPLLNEVDVSRGY